MTSSFDLYLQLAKKIGKFFVCLAAVVGMAQAWFEMLPDDLRKEIGDNKILAFARKAIDVVVTSLNAIGIFKKSRDRLISNSSTLSRCCKRGTMLN